MLSAIPKKDTLLRPKTMLTSVVGTKIWLTGTPKNAKCGVIWCDMKETFSGCFIRDRATGPHVNEMHGSEKGFVLEF